MWNANTNSNSEGQACRVLINSRCRSDKRRIAAVQDDWRGFWPPSARRVPSVRGRCHQTFGVINMMRAQQGLSSREHVTTIADLYHQMLEAVIID